jgi:hypothetical protein
MLTSFVCKFVKSFFGNAGPRPTSSARQFRPGLEGFEDGLRSGFGPLPYSHLPGVFRTMPAVEALEERICPDAMHAVANGNWDTVANWWDDTTNAAATAAPGQNDAVTISNQGITVNNALGDACKSLTLSIGTLKIVTSLETVGGNNSIAGTVNFDNDNSYLDINGGTTNWTTTGVGDNTSAYASAIYVHGNASLCIDNSVGQIQTTLWVGYNSRQTADPGTVYIGTTSTTAKNINCYSPIEVSHYGLLEFDDSGNNVTAGLYNPRATTHLEITNWGHVYRTSNNPVGMQLVDYAIKNEPGSVLWLSSQAQLKLDDYDSAIVPGSLVSLYNDGGTVQLNGGSTLQVKQMLYQTTNTNSELLLTGTGLVSLTNGTINDTLALDVEGGYIDIGQPDTAQYPTLNVTGSVKIEGATSVWFNVDGVNQLNGLIETARNNDNSNTLNIGDAAGASVSVYVVTIADPSRFKTSLFLSFGTLTSGLTADSWVWGAEGTGYVWTTGTDTSGGNTTIYIQNS